MGEIEPGAWKAATAVASLGIEMAIEVVIGYWLGVWLDEKFGSEPWLMYVFLVLGIAAAFRSLWRTSKRYWPKEDA